MQETNIKQRGYNVNWKQIKVIFVPAQRTKCNPLNPNSKLYARESKPDQPDQMDQMDQMDKLAIFKYTSYTFTINDE